jgi:hypothetical protein
VECVGGAVIVDKLDESHAFLGNVSHFNKAVMHGENLLQYLLL